jgi:DNA ligase-1
MAVRPMLSATIDPLNDSMVFDKLKFPLYASPKLDGIRAVSIDGQLVSRSGKLIPSTQAQQMFGHFNGLDGELIYNDPTMVNVYNTTQSFVMSLNKPAIINQKAVLRFYVFDRVADGTFEERLATLPKGDEWLIPVKQTLVNNVKELLEFESNCLALNYEGVMLKSPSGPYKQGRATFNEHYLLKLKRFVEFDAPIVGFVEQMTNVNRPILNDLGYTERSAAKEGLVPADTLGKIIVRYNGNDIKISCGVLDHAMRKCIWQDMDAFIGRMVVVRHFDANLEGYEPRFPRFVGWRDDGR